MQFFSNDKFQRLKEHSAKVERELLERISGYILAAFGLIAGLAWNDAIKGLIEYIFPLKKDSISAKFIYAGIVTVVVVLLTLYIMRLIKKPETDQDQHS